VIRDYAFAQDWVAIFEWVDWSNNRRLLSCTVFIDPAEAEEKYY